MLVLIQKKNNFYPSQTKMLFRLRFLSALLVAVIITSSIYINIAWATRYIDHGNGTVEDQNSGLLWQKADSYHELKKGINWYQALEYVDFKNAKGFAGFDDWRLPTLEELKNLYDPSRPAKSKDGERIGLSESFRNGGSYYLWTNTERGLENVWYFGLGFKEEYFNLKDLGDLGQGVKMVRGKLNKN
jgi:hypothetical protein